VLDARGPVEATHRLTVIGELCDASVISELNAGGRAEFPRHVSIFDKKGWNDLVMKCSWKLGNAASTQVLGRGDLVTVGICPPDKSRTEDLADS
jgi:hypothetical protein